MNTISSTKTTTNGESTQPALDKTGKFVAFASDALNLSTSALGLSDVYLKNTQIGDLTLLSISSTGESGNSNSSNPSISDDGRYVVFQSTANNFAGYDAAGNPIDNNSESDIFLKDTQDNSLKLVTVKIGDGESINPKISADGRYVVFQSLASNFADDDNNGAYDIYLRDLQKNTLTLISSDAKKVQGNNASISPSLSANGLNIAFASDADNLIGFTTIPDATKPDVVKTAPIDNNGNRDVFVKNVTTGEIQLISKNTKGLSANGVSDSPSLSADGQKIAFRSFAMDLTASTVSDGGANIFVKDLTKNTTQQITLATDGTLANGESWNPVISPDGNYVAFLSNASNLIVDDTNNVADVFVKNLLTGDLTRFSDGGTGDATDVTFSGDSALITFSRWANASLSDVTNTENIYSVNVKPSANLFNGDSNNNLLIGTEKNDTMSGLAGMDTLRGNAGNDSLDGGEGNDLLEGASGNDTLLGGNANDQLLGGAGNDSLAGGNGNDTLDAGAGNDTLNGGIGIDKMTGGDGNDYYYVDNAKDVVIETNKVSKTGGVDTVESISDYVLPENIEIFILKDTDGKGHKGTGNKGNNTITGSIGDDALYGLDGNDKLESGAGNDTLDGGKGKDTLIGGDNDDLYLVNNKDDKIIETPTGGEDDRVLSTADFDLTQWDNVENLTLSGTKAKIGTGNALNNLLQEIAGGKTNNRFYGNGGDDDIFAEGGNDTLEGGAGNDTLDGGAGKDMAVFYGKKSDYQITPNSDAEGVAQIEVEYVGHDVEITDGKDILDNIEVLQFADGDSYNVRIDADTVVLTGVASH